MIKHIVMWSMKKDSDLALKIGNAMEVKKRLESLKSNIFEIKKFEVGINFSNASSAYDIVLYSEFDSREGLDHYIRHPKHLLVREYIDNVTEEHHVIDYEI
ncbi:MAG: Dabb family protein [Candidatus Delongbacteria bacterium]|nr:Dabb family protein [Candidatus Delongbacteria bacterium]